MRGAPLRAGGAVLSSVAVSVAPCGARRGACQGIATSLGEASRRDAEACRVGEVDNAWLTWRACVMGPRTDGATV